MWGREFESMYAGSMYGAGVAILANMRARFRRLGSGGIESEVIGGIFGEKEGEIEEAIEKLCAPDPESTSKEEQGRRLVRMGSFLPGAVTGRALSGVRNWSRGGNTTE